MAELLVIANGKLQGGAISRRWQKIVAGLSTAFGNRIEIHYTAKKGDAVLSARQALLEGSCWLAAAGGDGTIHEVVNGFFEHDFNIKPDTALSFLPCGSGNDWARSLGLPVQPKAMVRMLTDSRNRKVDVGFAQFQGLDGGGEEQIFLNIAEAGVGAEVVSQALSSHENSPGRSGYKWRAIAAAFRYRPHCLELVFDESAPVVTDPMISLIVAGGQYFGAGMHCAPMARVDDGRLEVITIGQFSKVALLRKFRRLVHGTYLDEPQVTHCSVRRLQASSPAGTVLLELDGDLVGQLPATFRVLPQALNVRY